MNLKKGYDSTLVSIIVPVFNGEKHISKCIDSILSQTYSNFEIIVINDGSNDNTENILNSFTDPRLMVISKSNEGLSKARQTGIDLSKGDYFCTIDADDYYENSFLEKMVASANKNKADICICERYDVKNENRQRIILKTKGVLKTNQKNYIMNTRLFECGDSWNKLYKKSFVRNHNLKFNLQRGYNGNDYLFNHLCFLHCPIVSLVNEPLLNHTICKSSMVRTFKPFLIDGFIIVCEKIRDEMVITGFKKIDDSISTIFWDLVLNAYMNIAFFCPIIKRYKVLKGFVNKCKDFITFYNVKNPFFTRKIYLKIALSIQNKKIFKLIIYSLGINIVK